MIEVVSGLIFKDERVLFAQRPPSKDYAYAWETPGGKVEGNESHHAALRRELREELGIEVGAIQNTALWSGEVDRSPRPPVFVLMYAVHEVRGDISPKEGQGFGWFDAAEIQKLTLCPGNKLALPKLVFCMAHTKGWTAW